MMDRNKLCYILHYFPFLLIFFRLGEKGFVKSSFVPLINHLTEGYTEGYTEALDTLKDTLNTKDTLKPYFCLRHTFVVLDYDFE